MARRLGVQFAGAICHVAFRGNARQAIFTDCGAAVNYLIRRIEERVRTACPSERC